MLLPLSGACTTLYEFVKGSVMRPDVYITLYINSIITVVCVDLSIVHKEGLKEKLVNLVRLFLIVVHELSES